MPAATKVSNSVPAYPRTREAVLDSPPSEGPVLVHSAAREPRSWIAIRLLVAIPLATLSLAALFPFAVIPVSSQAVVNARLSEVRSPIEGTLRDLTLETGDIVKANEPMAQVVASTASTGLSGSESQNSVRDLTARSIELSGRIASGERNLSKLNQAAREFTEHLSSDLKVQLQSTIADRDAFKGRVESLSDEVERDRQAVADRLMPHTMLDQAMDKLHQAQQDMQLSSAQVDRLQAHILDLGTGYVVDNNSQTPPAIALRDQAAAELDLLKQEKLAVDRQIAQLKMDSSERSSGSSPVSILRSPVSGPVWARSASPSQSVGAGDDLFRVADDTSIHVEVWLDRRYGPQLSIGDIAMVYLSGLAQQLNGRVVAFQGTSRRRLDEEVNAIDLQPVHPDQYHVTIELAPSDRKSIYIGQAAKVLFPGSKDQFRAKLYSLLMRF